MQNLTNLILATDSYKLTHWNQYPKGTTKVYSYFEAREGATFPYTLFFGLQSILKQYFGKPVTYSDIHEAQVISQAHFGKDLFNLEGWKYIVDRYDGYLPLKIKAVLEGTKVSNGNVLMTVVNTDPLCWWLTNAVESILTHVWYPSTVATLSSYTKDMIRKHLEETSDNLGGLDFMLHDFGYRGASSHETAAIGGAGHLVNFKGTDTLPAMQVALQHYNADLNTLAFSVPATEHSVMTAAGPTGEWLQVGRVLEQNPTGIVSVVADSYNIYEFVNRLGAFKKFEILNRDGVFVVRPDSVTDEHPTPESLVVWILDTLWEDFGGTINSKGFKVLDPHVRVLWGDGIDYDGIDKILWEAQRARFSAENLVFGMGGGLLQKVNRDTQRFAFKSSAQERGGQWFDVYKDPIGNTKKSKKGLLKLVKDDKGCYNTIRKMGSPDIKDQLRTVFLNGRVFTDQTFDEVRARANSEAL